MSMKAGMLVAFLATHLITVFSTAAESARSEVESSSSAYEVELSSISSKTLAGCDLEMRQCLTTAWMIYSALMVPYVSVPNDCRRFHDLCKAGEIESVRSEMRSEMKSRSSAFEAERNANSTKNPADCDVRLKRCLNTSWEICRAVGMPCLLAADDCRRFRDLCKAGEIGPESARSEVESSMNAFKVQRNASSSENPADCKNQMNRCLGNVWISCHSIAGQCLRSPRDCYPSYEECSAAEIESDRSKMESSSRALEVERNANSSENPAETVQSEVEASSGAYEVERDANSSESPAGCGNELAECLDETWTYCRHFNATCLRILDLCYRISQLCEAVEIETVQSEVEASSGAYEVERSVNNSENLAGCGNELAECLDETWTYCRHFNAACLRILDLCYRISQLCEAVEIGNA